MIVQLRAIIKTENMYNLLQKKVDFLSKNRIFEVVKLSFPINDNDLVKNLSELKQSLNYLETKYSFKFSEIYISNWQFINIDFQLRDENKIGVEFR